MPDETTARHLALKNQETIAQLEADIRELKESVDGLLIAWKAGIGFLKFMKWISSIALAFGAMYWVGIDILKRIF